MQKVTGIRVRWLSIIDIICPAESLTPKNVNYNIFLNSFTVAVDGSSSGSGPTMSAMYAQRG